MEPAARRQAPAPERLGYTWLEFGRRDADGTAEFCTIGCGLKAVKGRGIAGTGSSSPTSASALSCRCCPPPRPAHQGEAAGGNRPAGVRLRPGGRLPPGGGRGLFGLGPHRYEALVNLLIQLRQPQLSKKPDEKLLSRALTEALPPLSPGLVTAVAEAFRGLDEERDALRSLAEAQEAATAFLGHYRRYAESRPSARPPGRG